MSIQSSDPSQVVPSNPSVDRKPHKKIYLATLLGGLIVAVVILALVLMRQTKPATDEEAKPVKPETVQNTVTLPVESLSNFKTAKVDIREVANSIEVPGTVEVNQLRSQVVSTLTSGIVKKVFVAAGDAVNTGTPLITISSPSVAELHGKLHEGETKLSVAKKTLQRVLTAENRVAILKAEADLQLAEGTLKRVTTLTAEGLAPAKDLEAAKAEEKRARAELDFQRSVPLNKEIAQAKGDVEIASAEVVHIRNALVSQGAQLEVGNKTILQHDISLVELKSPMSGAVIERFVNAGAGVEPAKPLFTLADTSTLWVIANVPQSSISQFSPGMAATVISSATNQKIIGRINYIDPRINEEMRTAPVRIEVKNPNGQLRVGMFVQVKLTLDHQRNMRMLIANDSIQKVGERKLVFVVRDLAKGSFESREVSLGQDFGTETEILSGLTKGENIVTSGSFVLKSALLKEQMGEGD